MITFVKFGDLTIKIDRPEEIKHLDKDICVRAYELLKGKIMVDSWTEQVDALFKQYGVKYELAKEIEYKEFLKKCNDVTLRL